MLTIGSLFSGIGGLELGFRPDEPHITCDGCGKRHGVLTKRHEEPCRWFLNRKPPPGWKQQAKSEFTFSHYCKACVADGYPKDPT